MRFFHDLRTIAFIVLDSLCTWLPSPRRDTAVILRLDKLGDFFLWLQSGAAGVSAFARGSNRHVVLVANAGWADYARFLGLWDEVVALDPVRFMRHPVYRLRLLLRLRGLGCNLLIQPRSSRVFLQEDEIARTCGAATRIGNAGTGVNRKGYLPSFADRAYTRLISVSTARDVHETARNEEFVRQLTGAAARPVDLGVRHPVADHGGLLLALGAGETGRVWPADNYVGLLEHLNGSWPALPIALYGAASERELADALLTRFPRQITDRVGATSIAEFVDAIARAQVVVCNDSAAFHISMALRKKVVCFLGGGHFGWFAPYPAAHWGTPMARVLNVQMECYWCNWHCKYPRAPAGAFRCVAAISLQSAIDALEELLRT